MRASEAWSGRSAIVTGASGGIGEELAVQLAAAGARVALAARRTDELERVAALCRAARPPTAGADRAEIVVIPCDVTQPAQCRALVVEAASRFGGLDVLVNNAGQGFWGRADEVTDLSVFESMLRVNYLSVVWVTLAALPHLKQSRGRILTVGSLSGRTGVPLRSAYGAAKHALAGFLDSLRIELAESGVSVTAIYPGFVTTGSQARNLGPDGRVLGAMPVKVGAGLSPAECARLLLEAGAARRREVVPGMSARFGMLLRAFAPGVVDRMVSRAIRGDRS